MGQLSAAAVGLSTTLLELVPLAVEVVKLAVRLGSLVFTVRDELEDSDEEAPWALLVDKGVVAMEDLHSILEAVVGHHWRKD